MSTLRSETVDRFAQFRGVWFWVMAQYKVMEGC